jgi:leader peptidase (prepilin peptidase)/N-methyltransferase
MVKNLLVPLMLFVFGTAFGSFLNVLIYRFSRKENIDKILTGRSYCPNCKTPIKWFDNIPLISYLVLRGRCRHCGWKIPFRYPLVELLGGITPVVFYFLFYPDWVRIVAYTSMVYILLVISFIDWETFEVPDILSYSGIALGLLFSPFRNDISFIESAAAAAAGFVFVVTVNFLYIRLRGITPLGLGDAFVLAIIGAFEGFEGLYCSIFLGSLFALLFYLPQQKVLRVFQEPEQVLHFFSEGA